ncbi:cytochrome C oxidase copper chaperone-domain-containing protein [Melampsora americana]|nr:cytochrome C oxidase copper chaperone-domain-containing protein [Melampsora americana]
MFSFANSFQSFFSIFSSRPETEAQSIGGSSDPIKNPLNPEGIRPCCACPDTKRSRDDCFIRYGPPDESEESSRRCADMIAAHRACMEQYGFRI